MVQRGKKSWLRAVIKLENKNNSQVKEMGDKAVCRSCWPAALTASQRKGN